MSESNICEILPMGFTTLELEDRDMVPYDKLIAFRPPIYVCTDSDYIGTPSTNGEILFNFILKIANSTQKEPRVIGKGVQYTNLDESTIEVRIKSKYIVNLLTTTGIYKNGRRPVFTRGSTYGLMGELGTFLCKSETKKIDFHKSRRNSFFVIRVPITYKL